jgi:hypothetical protein
MESRPRNKNRALCSFYESMTQVLERNQARCTHRFCFVSPQNRHPERSVPASGVAQSKDPEGCYLTQTFCSFSSSSARAWTFVREKIPTPWVRSSPSGSFDSAPRKKTRGATLRMTALWRNKICDPLLSPPLHNYGRVPRLLLPSAVGVTGRAAASGVITGCATPISSVTELLSPSTDSQTSPDPSIAIPKEPGVTP